MTESHTDIANDNTLLGIEGFCSVRYFQALGVVNVICWISN